MDLKNLFTVATIIVLAVIYIRHKKVITAPLAIAFIISLTWTTYFKYEYVGNNTLLFDRINIYPLVLWTAGLTLLWLTYTKIKVSYKFALITILYLGLLAAVETVGYSVLNIRLASNYTSLLGLGVIHAPLSMKIFYVVAGPVYIIIVNYYQKIRS